MIPAGFAHDWEAGWNSHDLDRILAHYTEDVVFRSRKAIPLTGDGFFVGKGALSAYWGAALDAQPNLRFKVTKVYEGHDILVIAYLNHNDIHAAETLKFDTDGKVTEASAAHATP